MDQSEHKSIFITSLNSFGPYLKITGRLNPNALGVVQTKIQYALQSCFTVNPNLMPAYAKLTQPGTYCLCKHSGTIDNGFDLSMSGNGIEMWCRAKISSTIFVKHNIPHVVVELVDYGYSTTVPCNELIYPRNQELLLDIPPLCSQFILLGICSEWKKSDLEEISRMVLHETLNFSIVMEIEEYKFINMIWKEFNLAEYLIHQKKIGAPVPNELLRNNFVKFINNQQQMQIYLPPPPVPIASGVMFPPNNNSFQNNPNNNFMYAHRTSSTAELSNYPMAIHNNSVRSLAPTGNLHSIIQGMHYQKNISTYIGHSINTYSTRYSRPNPPEQVRCSIKRSSATFKSNNLSVGSIHDVCISFVENGPCLFSIQLLSAQDELSNLMNKIETVPLKQFSEKPSLGTACVARYSEDGQLYRALITGVQPTSCKVAYIDYGNVAMVPYKDLFEIPDEFLDLKVFAIRFTLSGYKELEPIDENLKKVFKDMVIYKNFKLKVMPLEGPPLVQYCELFMNGKNILETLKEIQKCRLVFPKAETLHTNDVVEIRYIDSPKHFYVQKINNIEEFEKLMDNMFIYYNKKQVVPNSLPVGAPCAVKYDNEWYRAEVIRVDSNSVVVRHVDFGYEQKVTKNLLSVISENHLQLPRQAIQCCLKGFENNELSKDLATTQFEMLAEESNRTRRSFTAKVFRIQPNGINLVNLCTKDLNVMKKLYKLSMPFDQYLSMEKEEFNMFSNENGGTHFVIDQNKQRNQEDASFSTPSVTSSNDNEAVYGKKSQITNHFMNSSILPSNVQRVHTQNGTSVSTEWDKNSSASSVDHDSRSSSSEYKKKKSGSHYQRNTGSGIDAYSSASSSSHGEKRNSRSNRNLPPRFQNLKNQENENRRLDKYQQVPQQKETKNNDANQQEEEKNHFEDDSLQDGEEMTIEEYVPLDREFPKLHIELPAREEVTICWWISPHQFYTHLKSRTNDFEHLMRRIQTFYKNKPITQLPLKVGSHVIARYRKDNILYRARIIACNQMLRKFKVYFIDFGNQYTVSDQDIWQVEKRFSTFPSMAYLCSFSGIVSNYDHLYIIDEMEKYLPSGSLLICEYIERDEEMYYVNVNVNGMPLRETLKREGLITEVSPELRIELLTGQQIRAKIVAVAHMLNFQIQLEGCDPHIKFLCSYDDIRYVKLNPDEAKKFKEFYEGKHCILNISNVTENKVIMVKPLIPLWKEDIPTYICTYPIIWDSFTARVVHVQSSYRLFVQMSSTEDEIAHLIDDMFAYYEEGGSILKNLGSDCICAANGSDGNWYRARISKKTNDSVEVYYIDYGNTEIIPLQTEEQKLKIKQLEPQFYVNKSAYAIEINLPIKSIWADQRKKKKNPFIDNKDESDDELAVVHEIQTLTSDYELTVKAIEIRKNRLIADLCSNEHSIAEVLKEKGLIKGSKDLVYIRKIIDEETPNTLAYIETVDLTEEEEELKYSETSYEGNFPLLEPEIKLSNTYNNATVQFSTILLEQDNNISNVSKGKTNGDLFEENLKYTDSHVDMEEAILSHCDNPCRFFLHLKSKLEDLHKLQENLQIVASSLPPLMRILKGANCISLYSVDHQWYRAKIMDSELMIVQFIDYGNTDALTETTDIKEMNVFADIEPLCIPCALAIKPNGTADWVDAANNIFNNSHNKTLHFEYIVRGELGEKSFIRLFIDGIDVADTLIADGFAAPLALVPSGQSCFVSHINNLNDFYIQMEKDAAVLELIESYLSDHEKLPLIQDFTADLICAALFPDDGNWYRAKLLSRESAGYKVLFIDYGNTASSPQVKKISEEIAKLPFLSTKCALQLPEDIICWSDAAEEKFSEVSALGETVFVVELKQPSDHAIIDLLVDGHKITDDLAPLCIRKQSKDQEMNTSFFSNTLQTSICENVRVGFHDAIISHVNSPNQFYIQFACDGDKLEDMTITLNEIGMDEIVSPEIGMVCAAKFVDDGSFYRCRILEKCDTDDEYRVIFIDFGNEALTNDLRELPDDLRCIKEFAKVCSLEKIDSLNDEKLITEKFNAIFDECNGIVKVEVIDDERTPALVRLLTKEEECFIDKMERLNVTDDSAHSNKTAVKNCFISHAVSPEEFYIQMKSQTHRLDSIAKTLELASNMPTVDQPQEKTLYAAFSREDEIYYRGMIQKLLSNNEFDVLAVDYGHTILTNDLRELPADMRSIPNVAQKCCLNEVPTADATAIHEHFSCLLESHFGEMYQIDDEVFENGVLKVKLQISYQDVAEKLRCAIEEGKTSIETSPVFASLHNCTIIHVNSPNSFYVQQAEDVPEIEKITDILLDARSNFTQFENIHVGAICAAEFPEDGAFYRAKILSVSEKECEVLYLDFGNTSSSTEFRNLPTNLIDIEPYGKHCALENLSDIDFWSSEANICFNELLDSRFSETFQIEILKAGTDPIIVRLFYQESNVSLELISAIRAMQRQLEMSNNAAINPSSGI